MAKIKSRSQEVSAIDGGSMEKAAEVGVQFGCHDGVCGKCATVVLSGIENLSERSEAEIDMDLDPERRLMCQCTIKGGTVELDVE
jgi:ferredoxin